MKQVISQALTVIACVSPQIVTWLNCSLSLPLSFSCSFSVIVTVLRTDGVGLPWKEVGITLYVFAGMK